MEKQLCANVSVVHSMSPTKKAGKADKIDQPAVARRAKEGERKQRVHIELPWPLYERTKLATIALTKRRGYRVSIRDIAVPAIENYLDTIRQEKA